MADAKRVLVTGAGGAVARGVVRELRARGHFVRGFDTREGAVVDELHVGDIADTAAVRRAVEGVDAVVHLAAATDDAPFLEVLLKPNVVGLFNVMDAARPGGPGEGRAAKRVVLASSMQAVSAVRRETDRLLTSADEGPTNHYALTKVWAERMGAMYARQYGMTVIAARIGWLTRNVAEADRMHASQWGGRDFYLSQRDAGRFFAQAVEAELAAGTYACLYAVSKAAERERVDMSEAKRLIGYEPGDLFPEGLDFEWSPKA